VNIKTLIRDKDLRLTTARESLLKIFIEADKPLCYEEIKENITMDKTTFYRNMSTFEEKGIIKSFESNDKKRYHELSRTSHAHFICSICNNVTCMEEFPILQQTKYGKVETVIVKGTCNTCIASPT
jgi:Fur family ferric uptake transcriptional regulator